MDNDRENKKNKTIYLIDKKIQKDTCKSTNNSHTKNLGNKPSKYNTLKQSRQEVKVISYGITKKKKKVKKIFFKNKKTILIVALISIICFISYVIKNNSTNSKNPTQINFVSVDPSVNQDDFLSYANIISESVRDIIKIPNENSVITEIMHKNGVKILAQGYFYWNNGQRIYFDIALKKDKPISLLINGKEYVK